MGKIRNVVKKNKRIEEFKKELNLNEDKLSGVTAQDNAELDMIEFEEKRNLAYKNLHEVFGFGCCFQHIVYDIWLQQALPIIIEKVKGEIKEGEAVESEVIQKELSNMYYKC